jgi:ParB-like chromosome segregation protein Spo0J
MTTPALRVRTRSRPKTITPTKPASSPLGDLRLEITYRRPDVLKPALQQLRRRGNGQIEQIVNNMRRFGCMVPILIAADGTIIDGHAIWEAAKALPLSQVPTVAVDHLTEDEIRVSI